MITVTKSAAIHIAKQILLHGGAGIRVGVKGSGCSGMKYEIELADRITPDDIVFESLGVKVVTDATSLPIIDGMELDYVREGLQEKFAFNNPNVRSECGCGHSFSV